MKKIIALCFATVLCCIAYSQEKTITIDNTKHKYEDNFIVNNQTSETIRLDIFVKRKENSAENKIGDGIIPPQKTGFRIKTSADGDFDDYNYILVRPLGNLINYKVECKNDDIIFTIIAYDGIESAIVNSLNVKYDNELVFENLKSQYQDYIKIKNKTSSLVSCSLYGVPKGSEKEIFIGQGVLAPNKETELKTAYDGKLKNLSSIRFTSDAEIKDFDINNSSHDLNLIIYACNEKKIV